MGLDMYMTGRRYLSEHDNNETVQAARTAISKAIQKLGAPAGSNVRTADVEVAYWRKANAVHRWMVENIQDGRDDCGEYYFSTTKMQELLDACYEVLSDFNKVEETLPPTSGFFFGSTQVDYLYWQDIEYTRDRLIECLKPEYSNWEFYYRASW